VVVVVPTRAKFVPVVIAIIAISTVITVIVVIVMTLSHQCFHAIGTQVFVGHKAGYGVTLAGHDDMPADGHGELSTRAERDKPTL
jgi:hypothetical protein